ncbi:GGDEF domain-containing protein [Jannaschia pagri]|uniref:GGDEF domain-containing protein n=1 Tax=Jannaschia pagri TaxID=2829797 RepID=A0ABQ4NG37_9RHOB|nr:MULTISPECIES: GGDEF domain-containing protein [unclassified Jannaschia]GIT90517.1 GGDEF domain-containing protein [Jannaschia sp. AI_61]GIT93378.1 GGDEF domain-containing protein [Jannaschia sp. AI_62]
MTVALPLDVLDRMMPMHLLFDGEGVVMRAGPTLRRLAEVKEGDSLSSVLRVLQPRLGTGIGRLFQHEGRRLTIQLRQEVAVPAEGHRSRMRAVVYELGAGQGLMNIFFGADVASGVARHGLSAGDFAAFDPTVEILFLMEAQSAVLGEFQRLNTRLADARSLAESQAVTDKLTGLKNRRAMDRHLTDLAEERAVFGLMHLDLDYFKSVNDTLGHAAGDYVLSVVGKILRDQVRKGDMVARVGGDEFILVFAGCSDVDLMRRIAERIILRLEEPILWEGHECRISGSIGITMSTFYDIPEPDRLMSDADVALYLSKNAGRARCSVATPNAPPDEARPA